MVGKKSEGKRRKLVVGFLTSCTALVVFVVAFVI